MDNDRIVIARIEDKIDQARHGYYAVATGFLDMHEQSLIRTIARPLQTGDGPDPNAAFTVGDVGLFLYGGYLNADRRILIAAPRDLAGTLQEALLLDDWLSAVRVRSAAVTHAGTSDARALPFGARQLTHRDYLGSVLALGLERSVIGDILVRPDGADMIVKPEMSDFLAAEYSKAGRTNLRAEVIPVSEIIVPEQHTEEVRCSVSSVRLDNIVAAAFNVSRSAAVTAITRGLVSVDHAEVTKPDRKLEEGSSVSLRGKGKAVYLGESGTTKKGKVVVTLLRYK